MQEEGSFYGVLDRGEDSFFFFKAYIFMLLF